MTTTPTNGIQRLQEAHPWLTEQEARQLTVGSYYIRTRLDHLDGVELQEAMEKDVTKMCNDTRENLLTILPEVIL
jgi:hypothetical protein